MPHVVRDNPASNALPLPTGLFARQDMDISEPAIDLVIRLSIVEQATVAIMGQRSNGDIPNAEIHDPMYRHFSPRRLVKVPMRCARIPIIPGAIAQKFSRRIGPFQGPYNPDIVKESLGRVLGNHDLRKVNLRKNVCFTVKPNDDGRHLDFERIEVIPDDWATYEEGVEALRAINPKRSLIEAPVAVQWRKHDDNTSIIYPRFLEPEDLRRVTGVQIQSVIQSLGPIIDAVRNSLGLRPERGNKIRISLHKNKMIPE